MEKENFYESIDEQTAKLSAFHGAEANASLVQYVLDNGFILQGCEDRARRAIECLKHNKPFAVLSDSERQTVINLRALRFAGGVKDLLTKYAGAQS